MSGQIRYFKSGIIIALLLFGTVSSQFKICKKPWTSTDGLIIKYDKGEHLVGSAFLYQGLRVYGFSPEKRMLISVVSGFLWEVKDTLIPYRDFGGMGGDGFDYKDFLAGCIGIFLSYEFEKIHLNIAFKPYLERVE